MCVGCDVLEKDEDVLGRTRDRQQSAELEGGATIYLYGMEAFTLAMVVYCTASRSCTMAVSEADCGFDALGVR
jgi:hypothetical protein